MRRFHRFSPIILSAALASACESNDFNIDPLLATDTIELATPTSRVALPTAVDLTATDGFISGGRFPERVQDAEQWDLALRQVDGQLRLVPAGSIGLSDAGGKSRAAITEALTGRTFASVREAPARKDFVTDRGVALRQGEVYVARSRLVPCGFTASEQYSKIQPLEVDVAEQRVRLQIVTNGRCGDPRLVEVD